jgi:hypothetical protein
MNVVPRETVFARRAVLRAFGVVLLAAGVAGCGSSKTSAGRVEPPPTILAAPVQVRTFAQVERAVRHLYRTHPSIVKFMIQDVEYTPATRDRVLAVCHRGGPEKTASALESTRVLACAPLIFFFYSYGRDASVPDAVAVARTLYWYAVTANRKPFDAGPGLTRLLVSWGIS